MDAAPSPAHRHGRFHSGSGAASLFAHLPNAGLAHRAERSPCKREAGGSSPPVSTITNAAIVQWQGTALVRRKPAFDPPLRHHHSDFSNALVAKRQTQPPQKRPPSRRGGSSPPGCTIRCSLRQAAKASVLHTDISRFESWSEHQSSPVAQRQSARPITGSPRFDTVRENHQHKQETTMSTTTKLGRLCRRISTATDPERSSPRRLGNGLLIRAPEVRLLPGPPAAIVHMHTTSSIG